MCYLQSIDFFYQSKKPLLTQGETRCTEPMKMLYTHVPASSWLLNSVPILLHGADNA